MAYIDELYKKQEKIYRDCVEINNCAECPHCKGNAFRNCELTLTGREIDRALKEGR